MSACKSPGTAHTLLLNGSLSDAADVISAAATAAAAAAAAGGGGGGAGDDDDTAAAAASVTVGIRAIAAVLTDVITRIHTAVTAAKLLL